MDDKILLIIILISGIYFFNSIMKKREIEQMTTLGAVYNVVTKDGMSEFSKVNLDKSIFFNIQLEYLKKLPIADSDTINNIILIDQNKKEWSGSDITLYKIIKLMQEYHQSCDTNIVVNNSSFKNTKDVKDFIKMIPYFKPEILEKINYDSVRCFIKNYEPNNLINIIQLNESFPELFDTFNTIFINNYLYKITHLGVVKYKLNTNFETDDDSNLVNASFESTILNDVNNHINSNNLIVILKGEPYKLIENKIYHIITNDVFEIQVPKNLFKSKVEKDSPIDDEFDFEATLIQDETEIVNIKKEKIKLKNIKKEKIYVEETEKEISSEVNVLKDRLEKLVARSQTNRDDLSMATNKLNNAEKSLKSYQEKKIELEKQYRDSLSKINDSKEDFTDIIDDELIYDEDDIIQDEVLHDGQIKITSKIENKFNIQLKSIFYIDDKLFFMFKNHVYPNKGIGLRINYFINSNDLHIRSINNFYYTKDNKLTNRLLFICSSNLYFYIEDSKLSDLKYFDDDFKFKSTHTLDQTINCNQYKSVLSQLKLSKKISNEMRINVLKSLKCKF